MKTTNRPKPPKAVEGRLSRCRAAMKRLGVSAYLITNRPDQVYLTGFDGEDGAVIITSGSVHIITDGRFEETIRQQAPWANKHMRTHALADVVGTVCRKLRLKQLWFQADQVSVQQLADLRKPCRPTKLSPAPPIANDLRKLKDRAEMIRLREAIDVAEAAFKALRKQIRTGMTETDIAALLEYEMKRRGATEPSFPTIVAEGANAALPHAHPGKRRIKKGSLILIDWGARWQHYCSDLTRVLFMGTIPPRFERLYKIVLEAQIKAIDMIAAGQRCCDIDKAARDHIVAAGYGKEFGHGLGHGVGLDIHEEPRLKFGYTDKLEAGMVVTVEPGIYLPGIGGIRIEDDILVTAKGRQVLTTLPKSVASAVIKKR